MEIGDGVTHRWQAWLRRRPVHSFFPTHFCKAAMLEGGVSDHRHERMTVKALSGSSLEVVEAEFLFQLLMDLLADPSAP
jgi:hypothetical protein